MKYLRKFNSVEERTEALADAGVSILSYTTGAGMDAHIIPPIPPTNLVISCSNNTVTITADNATTIEYNTDGASTYTTYTQPFAITQTVTVYAKATNSDGSITGSQVCEYVEPIDYSTPFYIDVRGSVTLAATSGLQMSTDKTTWTNTAAMTLPTGKTYFRVATDQSSPLKPNWGDNSSSDYDIGGNINSLVKVNFENDTTCYLFYKSTSGFFKNKSKLKSAGNLIMPATTLVDSCYQGMFQNCTSLTTAPALPATTLADYCYYQMFQNCTSLTTAPALPATTLDINCYQNMFYGCTSLTTTPASLPATTLASNCYDSMFYGCTVLTTAPAILPATTLPQQCYKSMFQGCTSLTTAPELPATALNTYCYQNMFYGCISLTTTPASLPATTLASNCYDSMFYGCTALTTAPALPATRMIRNCYIRMFQGCTSLTTAPELPATTLALGCYRSMFQGCTSLTTAPDLPAITLAEVCYDTMFNGCTNLNYIKCLATTISAEGCTNNWVSSVAATGTFVKNPSMSSWTEGANGIPSGWTVQDA